MLAWIGKRLQTPWNRRTRWTPLLLNQREFQRVLAKERSRVDREDTYFGFIILRIVELANVKRHTVRTARVLHQRLRDTDEKGHLGVGRIGIMLPCTGPTATEYVLADVLRMLRAAGIPVEGEAFVYPDQDGNGPSRQPEELSGVVKTKRHQASAVAMMVAPYPTWKRAIDIAGATFGLAIAAPFIATCAVLIKCSSTGPVIFKQKRTGYLGEPFEIYKLRTMISNAEDMMAALRVKNERDGPAFKMRRDPRITLIGRFLRATGLDELPQLYNVLRGDMSLVGPRPLPIDEADQCSPWQRRRQEVKPGLTCFWQLAKSRQIPFIEWMRLDLRYARSASPALDIKLIAKTFASVFLGRVGH